MPQTTLNPYNNCPTYETGRFIIRLVQEGDAQDLLACYADPQSAPFFNSDNCTSNFVFTTLEEMSACIGFWLGEYARGGYVRFSIVDRLRQAAVGTIECFARPGSSDNYGRTGMLRIDLASAYETADAIAEILVVVDAYFFDLFGVQSMITKSIPAARERTAALQRARYQLLDDQTIIHFADYWVKVR